MKILSEITTSFKRSCQNYFLQENENSLDLKYNYYNKIMTCINYKPLKVHITSILFKLYEICIAISMMCCQWLFLLFTCKQHCLQTNESSEVQTVGVIRVQLAIVAINVLSKCSSIISHRSPKVHTSIFESHIDLRRATHRSSKVDTLIIDLRRSTHRYSKIDGGNITPTSISDTAHTCIYDNSNTACTCDPMATRALVICIIRLFILRIIIMR